MKKQEWPNRFKECKLEERTKKRVHYLTESHYRERERLKGRRLKEEGRHFPDMEKKSKKK